MISTGKALEKKVASSAATRPQQRIDIKRRAKKFEKASQDKNPRKLYALPKHYGGKKKRCSVVLNTAV
ncbi:hypothetical protein RB195_002061 [Necator americanus]|uniref:Uncharacterized protein n=1 Tax=Necator americanus TaxID=51031 RepID=A0ABR1DH78_NECAM